MRVTDIESIRLKIASPEDILSWSHGEVTNSETINYRTQRPEKGGLFCEKIFGPERDYECYCGKYKKIRFKGIVCDRCGVEITKSEVRRERLGHIKLACPVSHIWFLKGVPSRIGMILDIPLQQLEKVIYFTSYIVTNVDTEAQEKILEEIEKEYKTKLKDIKPRDKTILQELQKTRDKVKEEVSKIKFLRILSDFEYYDLSSKYGEIFEVGTGAEVLRKIFEKIDLKKEIREMIIQLRKIKVPIQRRKILRRLKIFQDMEKAKIRPEWMFLTVLPVLPPDLRPMVQLDGGKFASSDLNDLYRRVINRNNRLKYLLEISAPEVIIRNEKRMLQEAVDALIDNGMRKGIGQMTRTSTGGQRALKSLADMLKGKQGRFRQNLLGKRVDYSGRSVIVVGPDLKLDECGLPKKMALEIFKPFVIKKILEREMAFNVRTATKLIDEEKDEVWSILEEIVKTKFVLLNRAPTLHRLGIQAFKPVLIEGKAIKIHPMICKAFNADFDGDQMAVHLPLSDEAQQEAKEIMLSTLNLLKPATGTPALTLSQDIILGCYWLTRIEDNARGEGKIFHTSEEALLFYEFGEIDLRAKIKIRNFKKCDFQGEIETSVGRLIFNQTLPEDFPFENLIIKAKILEKIIAKIITQYSTEKIEETIDKIKNLGFEYSTLSGLSWGMTDLVIPSEKKEILEQAEKEISIIEEYFKKGLLSKEEKTNRIIEIWVRKKTEIEKLVPKTLLKNSSPFCFIDSGARGSMSQLVQMTGIKGLVSNPSGETIELPVKNSLKEGFNVLEYFISTHGARKGIVDTALRTATAGYLTRKLIDVSHEIIISADDCGDNTGIEILLSDAKEIEQNFLFKIVGRICLEEIKFNRKTIVRKNDIIDWTKGQEIVTAGIEKIRVRSPLSCKLFKGICKKCYGWDIGNNRMVKLGEAVGIVAAQAIGEPGTQLTMRTFHIGGVATGEDITSGLPRVQEIFEARSPAGKAEISHVSGKVLEITTDKVIRIKPDKLEKIKKLTTKKNKELEVIEYKILSKAMILVKPGQRVEKGQQLCEGSLDLKDLFKLTNKETVQSYILKEVQRIYISQGAVIHDKHIEIIIRQMFSRVKIKDPGDSGFVTGEIISRAKFFTENHNLKKQNKQLIKGVTTLLGITSVALTADSFLSAASFQETSRVLIQACLEGREDKLEGLKENVILGKLIPVGTGYNKKKQNE